MKRRQGFTITELLVSLALILFMMAILSEAFVAGLGTFRDLKSIGDMDQKLRTALVILTRDLKVAYVESGGIPYSPSLPAGQRLSDLPGAADRGFFHIQQGSPPTGVQGGSTAEGYDSASGYASYASPGARNDAGLVMASPGVRPSYYRVPQGHSLHFSVNLGMNSDPRTNPRRKENFLSAYAYDFPAPPNTTAPPSLLATVSPYQDGVNYRSHFGELAYFLRYNGTSTPGGLPLFTLYRRQLVVLTDTDAATVNGMGPAYRPMGNYASAPAAGTAGNFYELSCHLVAPSTAYFNNMTDLAMVAPGVPGVANRSLVPGAAPWGYLGFPILGPVAIGGRGEPNQGADVLLTDVLSFCVRTLISGAPDFGLPVELPSYDTSAPGGITIRALEITLRVWDLKTQRARQITLIQDL